MLGGEALDQGRVGEPRRPEDRPGGAGGEHRLDVCGNAQATAGLDRDRRAFADPGQVLDVDRRALAGAVEIDHVKRLRPLLEPAFSGVDRVGVERRLAVVVALHEAHGFAAADIDRGIEDHAGCEAVVVRAQMVAKLPSRRRPAVLDFSG